MASFAARAKPHDEQALAAVIATFQAEGFVNFTYGTERTDSDALQKALRQQRDRTSIMLRYRPDQLFIKPGARTVLCEVKSEGVGYPNFSVEADAYQAGMEWNASYRHVLYAFCDLKAGKQYACWAGELPSPRLITVPIWHREFAETMHRLPAMFPNALLQTTDRRGGSGTAYFLVPKPIPGRPSSLRPLDLFVRHDVWAAVNGMERIGAAS